ncbi:MAG: hypothetical protein IJZ23_11115 [Roseburia sp.]|nr:hypothetical protein [Roseburia sp.]
MQNALEETGRALAILSVEELENPEIQEGYFALAKSMVCMKLKDDGPVEKYITGGALGVSLLASEFEGDYILLNANYVMRFPIKLFGYQDFLICHKTRFRKWTGWHAVSESDEAAEWVYITEHGEVYHMRTSCPYLDLSIQEVPLIELGERRNYSGEIYDKCELCKEEREQKTVYITNYGDKYHLIIDCAGLKRTIYQKKLSEVGGMRACSKCVK